MLLIYILLVIVFLLILYIYRLLNDTRRSMMELQQQISDLTPAIEKSRKHNQSHEDAIQELRAGTLGMGQKLKEINALLTLTRDKQEELSNLDPDNRFVCKGE